MSRIVLGVYAHVDAGKTTLSEAILHKAGVVRKAGRIDHGDSFLDYYGMERDKGITVFSKEARFSYRSKDYVFVDTPGHLDFQGEAERTLRILDLAVLVIDGNTSLPQDAIRRFRSLEHRGIPVFLFVNKMDIAHRSREEILSELKQELSDRIVSYEDIEETAALKDETLLEEYLNKGHIPLEKTKEALREGEVYPVFFGSALKEEGVGELLDTIDVFVDVPSGEGPLKAYVYKIDEYAHLKVFSGTLKNRSSFGEDKISEISLLSGNRREQVMEVSGNDLCAVKGLHVETGTYLPSFFHEEELPPESLTYEILSPLDDREFYKTIEPLSRELPELGLKLKRHVTAQLTGELQKELIRRMIQERWNIDISFSDPLVEYHESIEEETYGVGHYEPLRHYAEVLVKLRPAETYRVKASREQAVLRDYLLTYIPHGLLTDSPLDQIEIEITAVRTHLKHTEGGDLVEALERAIRHALYKTKSVLLEPVSLVSFKADDASLNRIIGDLTSRRYLFDSEEGMVLARVPKKDLNDFLLSLRSRLRDSFSYQIEGTAYDRCHEEEEVIRSIGYDCRSDTNRPIGSIFTRNGAGTYIPPEEVEENMHLLLSDYFETESRSVSYRPRTINEEELKRVWNSLYKPRPRYIERKKGDEEKHPVDLTPPKPLLYLVDGYNLMHAAEGMPLDDLLTAREKVVDLCADFRGYVDASLVLVFDAYKQDNSRIHSEERDGISIVYTRTKQTADMYIEEKSRELVKPYKVIVVTSDALEQLSIFSTEATRLSSREFLSRYQNMKKNMTHMEKAPIRPLEALRTLLEED